MPKVRMQDGTVIEVPADALFADDGQSPLVATPPTPGEHFFTADDIARARQEEKDKLYGRIDSLTQEITSFKEQVGTLTEAEKQRQAEAEAERRRLEEEARRKEEEELDAKSLLQRQREEWDQQLKQMEQTFTSKLEEERQRREQAEALAQREREFADLREYAQSAVDANKDKIAPQLLSWVTGNSKEEIDAAVARAIETTDAIVADMQQSMPPVQDPNQFTAPPGAQQVQQPLPPLPGTRPTAGPGNMDPAAPGIQQLTPDQIKNMPMDQYAQLRRNLNIGGNSNQQGLFG